MGCLKCGEATRESHVFCDACIEAMQQYPVAQDTAIQLPRREAVPTERKTIPLRESTPKQQVARLRAVVKALLIIIIILSVLLCLMSAFLIQTLI